MNLADIKGSVALVTGGSNGIGAEIARRLAGLGAKVVIADIDTGEGEKLATEIGGLFVVCDVSKLADNEAAVAAAVERYGGLHIVALNAGVSRGNTMGANFDPSECQRVVEINLFGVMWGANAAYPALVDSGGGEMIATASVGGMMPVGPDPVYGLTKHAVIGMVRSLGPTWAAAGVRINAICPAVTETRMITNIRHMIPDEDVIPVGEVADGFATVLTNNPPGAGKCWIVERGKPIRPFQFAKVSDLLEKSELQLPKSTLRARGLPAADPRTRRGRTPRS